MKLKKQLAFNLQKQTKLTSYNSEAKLRIIADYRENSSLLLKELHNLGLDIKLEKLDVRDYVLSERVGIEYKTTTDFINSIVDGRLINQLKELKTNFERPILIIEGTDDIYKLRNVHANAIRGMIATIAVSFGVPIINTKDYKETALMLMMIANREQSSTSKDFCLHTKKPLTLKEQQEYFISALPNVGPKLAKNLLKKFRSVKNILNASEPELESIPQLGNKIAKKIKEVIQKDYEP
jgi:Fanconi anemia group M protein